MGKRKQRKSKYSVNNGTLYKRKGDEMVPIANFIPIIRSQKIVIDEGKQQGRILDLEVQINGLCYKFSITSQEFLSNALIRRILDEVGPAAIVYGSARDLRNSAQELSGRDIPTKIVTTSVGLTPEGNYLSSSLLITPKGIINDPKTQLDLSEGSFSRHLGFLFPERAELLNLNRHVAEDFLALKSHAVTYPLIGHIVLAPFASAISEFSGKKKPAMHLQGPSGGGKTFLGDLAMCFFGSFQERPVSWSSTANAIEKEGFYFRDSLFFIDDLKPAYVDQQKVVRILQGYADAHGRSRLNSNSRLQDLFYIRGLLLSTGEGFITDVESVTARTIVIPVEWKQNLGAGSRCWQKRSRYPMFLPGLIQLILKEKNWQGFFRQYVDDKVNTLQEQIAGLSNGLRIASNWALNSLGFNLFAHYLLALGIIDHVRLDEMLGEYDQIVHEHIRMQSEELRSQTPTESMFRILGQRLATGVASISESDTNTTNGRNVIGYQKRMGGTDHIFLLPDSVMRQLVAHFRSVGERTPFLRSGLRDALAKENLIRKAENGRWTIQFRGPGGNRFNGWQFDREQFNARAGIDQNE